MSPAVGLGIGILIGSAGWLLILWESWSEKQAATAELTMQEAAAAPFVAPFAHVTFEVHTAQAIAMLEDAQAKTEELGTRLASVPEQRDGRWS